MSIITERFSVNTKGYTDILNITGKIQEIVTKHKAEQAQVLVYVPGSTASITTVEYEPGLIKDLPEAFEKIAPMDKTYHHDEILTDKNHKAYKFYLVNFLTL